MTTVSNDQCRQALAAVDTDASREVMNNADLFAMFVGLTNGSLAALGKPIDAAFGVADKMTTLADGAGKIANSKTVKLTSSSAQIIIQSLSLIKLGTAATPGMVVATVGAMFTKKVALAFGLVEDDKSAKIVAAIADLTSAILVTGISYTAIAGATTIVPAILLVGAAAQLSVTGWQAYNTYTED